MAYGLMSVETTLAWVVNLDLYHRIIMCEVPLRHPSFPPQSTDVRDLVGGQRKGDGDGLKYGRLARSVVAEDEKPIRDLSERRVAEVELDPRRSEPLEVLDGGAA